MSYVIYVNDCKCIYYPQKSMPSRLASRLGNFGHCHPSCGRRKPALYAVRGCWKEEISPAEGIWNDTLLVWENVDRKSPKRLVWGTQEIPIDYPYINHR